MGAVEAHRLRDERRRATGGDADPADLQLVTNAVVHTGCPAVLRMLFGSGAAEAGTVRVEVADTSARPPSPRHAQGEDTNGRGLELVDGLADRWGWQPEGSGKRIWCEVDRCEPDAAVEYEPPAPARTAGPDTTRSTCR